MKRTARIGGDPHDVRERQRVEWSAAAAGWAEDREAISVTASPVTRRLIELAGIRKGDAVVDIACGTGDPAFAIARAVGESGRVVGLDLTPAMVERAGAIASEFGVGNVEFRAVDDELSLGVERGAFDAITCRYGLMYMPDPPAATRAWRPALRSGGRIAVSTWASLPLLPFVLGVAARHALVPSLDPEKPGVLALSTTAKLRAALVAGGYTDVRVELLRTPAFEELPPEQWWDLVVRSAGPLVMFFKSLSQETRAAIREDGLHSLRARHPSGVVAEFGDALLASGVNPG
jgi:SAM-dependent methyltransferase